MTSAEDMGEIVRFHRRKSGLTQLELAKMAGVGKTSVFDIEKGKKTVRLNTLLSVLEVMNINLNPTSPLMSQFLAQKVSSPKDGGL